MRFRTSSIIARELSPTPDLKRFYVAGWKSAIDGRCCVDIPTDFYRSSRNISEVILFISPTSLRGGDGGEGERGVVETSKGLNREGRACIGTAILAHFVFDYKS